MKQSHKTLLLWVLLILMFVAIWTMVSSHSEPPRAVAFTEFVTDIQEGKVTEVVVRTQDATGHYRYRVRGADGERPEPQPRETFGILSDQVNEMLMNSGARVEYQPKEENILAGALLTWLPMLFLLGIFFFFMRQLQASGGKAMSFGKSKANGIDMPT